MVIAFCRLLALLHVVPLPVPSVVTRMTVWACNVVVKNSEIMKSSFFMPVLIQFRIFHLSRKGDINPFFVRNFIQFLGEFLA